MIDRRRLLLRVHFWAHSRIFYFIGIHNIGIGISAAGMWKKRLDRSVWRFGGSHVLNMDWTRAQEFSFRIYIYWYWWIGSRVANKSAVEGTPWMAGLDQSGRFYILTVTERESLLFCTGMWKSHTPFVPCSVLIVTDSVGFVAVLLIEYPFVFICTIEELRPEIKSTNGNENVFGALSNITFTRPYYFGGHCKYVGL